MTEVSKKSYRALRVAIILNLLMGVQYCWSVISPGFTQLLGWSPTEATLPYTVLTITNTVAGIPLADWGEKKGPCKVIFLGGICVGAGVVLCSVADSLLIMIIGYGILAAFGLASISMNTTATAMKWFPDSRKGFISGACTMCIGLSSVYMAPFINGLLHVFGLRNGLRTLGLGAGVLICVFSLMLPSPVSESKKNLSGAVPAEDKSRYHGTVSPSSIVKTREFWLLLILYAMNWMPGQMFFSSVSTICQVQAGWERGYIAVMAMALGNGAGRFLAATISDKLGGIKTMSVLMLVQLVNLSLFALYRTSATILPGIIVLGFCVGAGVPLLMVLSANIYGMRYVGTIFAILQIGYSLAGVIGPQVAARILEHSGSYTVSYYVNVVFILIGFLCTLALKKKKQF